MIHFKYLGGLLLATVLGIAGCYTTLEDNQHGLIYGCGGDGGVTDAAPPPPDMWIPTCKYDWIPQSRAEYVYTPWTSTPTTARGSRNPFVMYPDPEMYPIDGSTYTEMTLRPWPDPYNPAFTRCPGCTDAPYFAKLPHIQFGVDIKAIGLLPKLKAGDLDVWVQVTHLYGTSRRWWSPQTTLAERKLMPGHYDFDFTVPFNPAGVVIRVVVQNSDLADDPAGGHIAASITSKSMKTTQPCAGWFADDKYPITSSIP